MDQLLVDITHAFEPRYRTSKITKLFTIDGDEVVKVDELFDSKDSTVSKKEVDEQLDLDDSRMGLKEVDELFGDDFECDE